MTTRAEDDTWSQAPGALTVAPASRQRLVRVGTRLTTTPGRMRLASAAIVAGLILFGTVGTVALHARQHAARDVGVQAEPLLVGAQVMFSSLADADATAAGSFLTPGIEPPERRKRYLDDIEVAADRLAVAARQGGLATQASDAIAVITRELPTYSGLVEAARANNRQGLPVGAAYLREGSTLMRGTILPAARRLYQVEADSLDRAYRSGQSGVDTAVTLLVAAIAVAALVITQLFLFRRTNRLLNIPLLATTLITLVIAGWTVFAFFAQAGHLRQARTRGSDPVQLLSAARILTFRAQGDESLALVARGSGDEFVGDMAAVLGQLGPPEGPGLIFQADHTVGFDSIPPISGKGGLFAAYLDAHDKVVKAEQAGQFTQAVELATGSGPDRELPAADQLAAALDNQINHAQQAFAAQAGKARRDISALGIAAVALLVAAGLALLGLQQRINEYR